MTCAVEHAKITGFAAILPAVASKIAPADLARYEGIYEQNRHRVYALAFWMTGHELAAEKLMRDSFLRAFAGSRELTPETIDRAFLAEVGELMPVGLLTLEAGPAIAVENVRRNMLRTDLEKAVVEVPPTERLIFLMHDAEGYEHDRIAKLLGLSREESQYGLHQARLRIRQLVAEMEEAAGHSAQPLAA